MNLIKLKVLHEGKINPKIIERIPGVYLIEQLVQGKPIKTYIGETNKLGHRLTAYFKDKPESQGGKNVWEFASPIHNNHIKLSLIDVFEHPNHGVYKDEKIVEFMKSKLNRVMLEHLLIYEYKLKFPNSVIYNSDKD